MRNFKCGRRHVAAAFSARLGKPHRLSTPCRLPTSALGPAARRRRSRLSPCHAHRCGSVLGSMQCRTLLANLIHADRLVGRRYAISNRQRVCPGAGIALSPRQERIDGARRRFDQIVGHRFDWHAGAVILPTRTQDYLSFRGRSSRGASRKDQRPTATSRCSSRSGMPASFAISQIQN